MPAYPKMSTLTKRRLPVIVRLAIERLSRHWPGSSYTGDGGIWAATRSRRQKQPIRERSRNEYTRTPQTNSRPGIRGQKVAAGTAGYRDYGRGLFRLRLSRPAAGGKTLSTGMS